MKKLFVFALSVLLMLASCGKKSDPAPTPEPEPEPEPVVSSFIKGADVSWLPAIEEDITFKNAEGKEQDCLQTLKENGINAIRLRVFVNPSDDKVNGRCSIAATVEMAKRVKALDMKLLVDLHYSDTWADPSDQEKPAAWADHDFDTLLEDVADHTADVLDALKAVNITPEWIQLGNEITSGMLWPDGRASGQNFTNLGKILNRAAKVVREKSPETKIIIHVNNGQLAETCAWFFDGITSQNVDYDIIGVSYYAYWIYPEGHKDYTESMANLEDNVKTMRSKYGKEVFIIETGDEDTEPEDTYNMVTDLIKMMRDISDQSAVFYWEPEHYRPWSSYMMGAWQKSGIPTKVIEAFKN